jgi:FkbM family methyltransferase
VSFRERVAAALLHPPWVWRRLYWSWVIRRQPPAVLTKTTANGRLSFDTRDHTIGRALYVKRQYEMDLVQAALATLRAGGHLSPHPSGCVIDIGANIGVICIALLKHGYFREAVAIEPDAANFALLERNVAQNGLRDSIRCLERALSNEEGVFALERSPDNWGGHRLGAPTQNQGGGVAAITLDGLVSRDARLSRPDSVSLVWIDVEGHEGWCFAGARRLLSRGVPVVAEFWADGIVRAGMSPGDYAKLLGEIFTHFYAEADAAGSSRRFIRHPIAEIPRLFERFPWTRERNIILVNAG